VRILKLIQREPYLKDWNIITIRNTIQHFLKNKYDIDSKFLYHPFYPYPFRAKSMTMMILILIVTKIILIKKQKQSQYLGLIMPKIP